MLVQLQPVQISALWENIRVSVMKTARVLPEQEQEYSKQLLKNLLSGKFQTWILYKLEDDQRHIVAIAVSAIIEDNLFGSRSLHLLSLYGLRFLDDKIATSCFEKFAAYGRRNGCVDIKMTTHNKRIIQLAEMQNMESCSQNYILPI